VGEPSDEWWAPGGGAYPQPTDTAGRSARGASGAGRYQMAVLLIFDIEVTDPEGYEEYRRLAGAAHGGEFVTRGGKTWPSWQLIGAILGVDALATIFCAFGWLSGGISNATSPRGLWQQREDGWTDIVTIVVIWGYSIGVTIVIAIVYYLLNRITWLDNLGRKNRSHKDPAIENMIAALSKLALEHGTDKHGNERYVLAPKAAEEEEDD